MSANDPKRTFSGLRGSTDECGEPGLSVLHFTDAAHQPSQAYARAVVLGEKLEAAGFGIENLETLYLPSTPRVAGFIYWVSARRR